eukprot:14972641-Alexandrium_andersonii.AAC.1
MQGGPPAGPGQSGDVCRGSPAILISEHVARATNGPLMTRSGRLWLMGGPQTGVWDACWPPS